MNDITTKKILSHLISKDKPTTNIKQSMEKKLFTYILVMLTIGTIRMQAENTAYAYYSNNTLTFRYGEIPANSVQTWDVSDTGENAPEWSSKSSIRNNISTIVFHESFVGARPKSCYAWFQDCAFLKNIIGIENLNTSEVASMKRMFAFCSNLSSVDISTFDTSNLTNVTEMFINCSSLYSVNIGNMNLSKVTSLERMFYGCTWLKSIDLTKLNTSNIESMYCMFMGCENIETIDLCNFNTQNMTGTGMGAMFSGCKKLTTIYVGDDWSNERTMSLSSSTFYNCYSLVGGNGTKYSDTRQSAYYARIDTNETPGYMTYKKSPTGVMPPTQKVKSEIIRYNIQGQMIPSKQKGVNIIKMSDGTTKKTIVR